MVKKSSRTHLAWYESTRPLYEAAASTMSTTLDALIRAKSIDIVGISRRTKTVQSFAEKLRRKRYTDPARQMTDLAGIRVVTLIERDVAKVEELIRSSFHVHASDSKNKSQDLGTDKFGYRSVHLVFDIGPIREKLPEFQAYSKLVFEVQIRTALQHAWAEIEHDRGYKFAGELPSAIKRRFHLVAGLLELADREFGLLTEELERYSESAQTAVRSGSLDLEFNSTTASELLLERVSAGTNVIHILENSTLLSEEVMEELRNFGIEALTDLDAIVTKDFLSTFNGHGKTIIGVARNAMMFQDIHRYFQEAWNKGWTGWVRESYEALQRRYSSEVLQQITDEYQLELDDE